MGAGLAHRQFELQAQRFPEAIAVSCGDDSITYGELNARATAWHAAFAPWASAPRYWWAYSSAARWGLSWAS